MKNTIKVYGHAAPGARMTKTAAVLLASILSIPTFIVLTLLDLLVL